MKWLPKILAMISLIGLIGLIGREEARAAGASKLGIFLLAYFPDSSNAGQKIINACPKAVTFYDPQNSTERIQLLRDYKTKCPDSVAVLRLHDALEGYKFSLKDDPVSSADKIFEAIRGAVNDNQRLPLDARNMIDYVSGTNEFDQIPVFDSVEAAEWTAKFWSRLAENIKRNLGKKPNIGDINVGFPHDITLIKYLLPAFQKVKEMDGAISYHGYTVDYAMDVNTELASALRYRLFYEYINKDPKASGVPLLITETGAAEAGTGIEQKYAGYMPNNIEKFKTWLDWYDGQLQQDGYVIGATIFQSGDTGQWASFNTDYIAEWLCTKLGGTDCKATAAEYKGTSGQNVDKCQNKKSKIEEFKEFLGSLFKKNVSDLKRINKGSLPPLNIESGGAKKDDGCPDKPADTALEGAQQYNIAASRGQPPGETSQINWWQSAWDKVKDAFSKGNEKAEEYLNASLPPGVGSNLLTYQSRMPENSSNVLGLFASRDKAMEKALSIKYCAGLPAGSCGKNNMPFGTEEGSIPTPGVGSGQYPEISPPAGCGQADSGTEGYTGNECALVQTGWCSISCLKKFTGGNTETAARLSQICMLESGGEPEATNKLCLVGKSYDFSIGLFQINLIAHCRHEFTQVSSTDKMCELNPSYIVGTDSDNLPITQCEQTYKIPIENINKAYSLTAGGTNWNPWKIASERCGFIKSIENMPR